MCYQIHPSELPVESLKIANEAAGCVYYFWWRDRKRKGINPFGPGWWQTCPLQGDFSNAVGVTTKDCVWDVIMSRRMLLVWVKRGHCRNAGLDLAKATKPTDVSTTTVDLRDSAFRHLSILGLRSWIIYPRLHFHVSLWHLSLPLTMHVFNAASLVPLPAQLSPMEPNFVWSSLYSSSFVKVINEACVEVVHRRKHLFPVPNGQCGKSFVSELTRLFAAAAYGENSSRVHSIEGNDCGLCPCSPASPS